MNPAIRAAIVLMLPAFLGAAAPSAPARAPTPNRASNLGLDATQPIAINADSFLADLNGEIGTYTGNVIVSQGSVRLHADEVKVTAPSGRASRMEAQGHVIVNSSSGRAIGDRVLYDVTARTLRLNGNVVLTKDANVMRGTALEISMATGLAKLTAAGAADTPAGTATRPAGRVQGLFQPAQ